MDLKQDEGLKTLLDSGKEKGYLTYSQVNEYLPDDAVNPEKLDSLLIALDELGIELVNEAPSQDPAGGVAPALEGRGCEEIEAIISALKSKDYAVLRGIGDAEPQAVAQTVQ